MDGYAVRSSDTPGKLEIVGESAAGRAFMGRCEVGKAIRISTGAALPEGADTIVIQELVERCGTDLQVPLAIPGTHIRRRGLDFAAGSVLLEPGRTIDGVALAHAAASGAATICVSRAPRIALLCGGDELVEPGTTPGPFQIFESCSYGVAGLVEEWGGTADRLAIGSDNADHITACAKRGLEMGDLLVVIGGASVGDHDLARPALRQLGLEMLFEKISVRPGKPTWFGMTPFGPVLGLPGNPASALVCAYLFLRPLMDAMIGREAKSPTQFQRARLGHSLPKNGDREHYLRCRAIIGGDGVLTANAYDNQDSSMLSVFASANALVRLAPHADALAGGEMVDVLMLDSP
jgi:molybdopterin molybdotransferase